MDLVFLSTFSLDYNVGYNIIVLRKATQPWQRDNEFKKLPARQAWLCSTRVAIANEKINIVNLYRRAYHFG